MKIAQISPLYESVPPKLYGGTERIISYLTSEQKTVPRSVRRKVYSASDGRELCDGLQKADKQFGRG